ncbi:MAG: hypothetical protein LJF04_16505 [Gemmatimonadetes bacterium]|nr:hypothetical protein [Gemmatimonadota bacterium]
MRTPSLAWSVIGAACLAILLPEGLAAQASYTATATYQVSLTRWDSSPQALGADYRSWGVMLGMVRPHALFSPHVWFQRYKQAALCPTSSPGVGGCDNTGWVLSVGPALRLVSHGPWHVEALADVDLGPRTGPNLDGGAALSVGVHLGGFRPQAFTRVMRLHGWYYSSIGVGLRFELR